MICANRVSFYIVLLHYSWNVPMKKSSGLFWIIYLYTTSLCADIILGGDKEIATPREDLDKVKVLSVEALKKDNPGNSVKQGMYSRSITYGEKSGDVHAAGARQLAMIETLEAQQNEEEPASESRVQTIQTGQSYIVSLGEKAVHRIHATPFSPNIIVGSEKNAILQASVGATISGGGDNFFPNEIGGDYGVISGGMNNRAGGIFDYLDAPFATVGGGKDNQALRRGASIGGGVGNRVEGLAGTVPGGQNNVSKGAFALISGGHMNGTFADYATVGGGHTNQAVAKASSALGGEFNRARGVGSTISGGLHNETTGKYATIPGGSLNKAEGNNAFAAGNRAEALHHGSFVWADSQDASFASSKPNQFIIRAEGHVGIGTAEPTEMLTVNGNIAPAEHNRSSLGSPHHAFRELHLQGDIRFQNEVTFSASDSPVMMLDQNGDLVLSGRVYAAGFADRDGNPMQGATIDEVAEVLAAELHALHREIAAKNELIAEQQRILQSFEMRLDQLEQKTAKLP